MVRLIVVALVSFTLLLGCELKSTLYLTGSDETIGAKVCIDNTYVGEMKGDENVGLLIVKIEPGEHQLLVRSKGGKKFTKKFSIKGENYISVVFEDADSDSVKSD